MLSVLAYCYFQVGDYQQAAQAYAELSKLCPEITDYQYYGAQSLLKAGLWDDAMDLCERLEKTHYQQKAIQLKAAISYEKNEFQDAKKHLRSLQSVDFSSLVNEGCIYFKQEDYQRALAKFNDAIKICGFNAELFYNISLAYYEMREYRESLQFLDMILAKAHERFPQLA